MKKNVLTSVTVSLAAAAMISGTAMAAEYKVGIIQFVDDASLNQIEQNIEKELTTSLRKVEIPMYSMDMCTMDRQILRH